MATNPTLLARSRRWAPPLLLLAALGLFVAAGGHEQIHFAALRDNYTVLRGFTEANQALAAVAFVGLYAALVAIFMPGVSIMTVAGGLLFGTLLGSGLAVAGATLGGIIAFLVVRTTVGGSIRRRAGPILNRLRDGFERNAFLYLLLLRLTPVVPFWLINIAPALLGVSVRPFILATVIGIAPATIVYASVGDGAANLIEMGSTVPLEGLLLKPEVLLPIAGLALLGALPLLIGHLRTRHTARSD